MKSKIAYTALCPILLVALFPTDCNLQKDRRGTQEGTPMSKGHDQSRVELLRKVQLFASNDDEEAARAWQDLQNQDRQKLVNELNSVAKSVAANDRNRVFIAFTLCRLNQDYDANRNIVLSALAEHRPYKDLGGDWAADLVARLMVQGDLDLLKALFSASSWGDGAMGTELASAYSQALVADPEHFLQLLVLQPKAIRRGVTMLLEHHTLTAEERQKVNIRLSMFSRQSKFREMAMQIMHALSK
jgi:hypothetical protein